MNEHLTIDPYAQGVFLDLFIRRPRYPLPHSVLEGVTFALSDGLDALRADAAPQTSLCLIGGGARSTLWAQLFADASGVPIRRPPIHKSIAALGAARLGWLASATFRSSVRSPSHWQDFFPVDRAAFNTFEAFSVVPSSLHAVATAVPTRHLAHLGEGTYVVAARSLLFRTSPNSDEAKFTAVCAVNSRRELGRRRLPACNTSSRAMWTARAAS